MEQFGSANMKLFDRTRLFNHLGLGIVFWLLIEPQSLADAHLE
jgi:hypothetical protein